MAFTALDAVRKAGIIIASDGAEYHKIAKYNPTDATTNPSLVYAAVSTPDYAHLVENAVEYAQNRIPLGSVEEKTELAMDHLLLQIGAQILALIPGRVSLSIDPRLATSTPAILAKSRALLSLADDSELRIPRARERLLVKIPATHAGIHAAHVLETRDDIRTNMTLVFGMVQALACAQAGVSVISPFVGRVRDWWAARAEAAAGGGDAGLAEQPQPQPLSLSLSLSEHPGIHLVHRIRAAYTLYGYTQTQIMAAGFRSPSEIIELSKHGRSGGQGAPDLVTLPPELLEGLMSIPGEAALYSAEGFGAGAGAEAGLGVMGVMKAEVPKTEAPVYFTTEGPTAAFARDLREEAIALDKVPEGLAKFSVDAVRLEKRVRELVVEKAGLALVGMKQESVASAGAGVGVGVGAGAVGAAAVPVPVTGGKSESGEANTLRRRVAVN